MIYAATEAYLDSISVREVIIVTTALGLFWGFLLKVLPKIRTVVKFFDAWFGDPTSTDPNKQGMLARMDEHTRILQQLQNNGGGSVKDKIDATYNDMGSVKETLTNLGEKLEQHIINSTQHKASELLDRENSWQAIHRLENLVFNNEQIPESRNEDEHKK